MTASNQTVGNLSGRPLAHLCLWVHQNSFSGVLVLAQEDVKKSLVFEKGKLVAARSNVPGEILGAILVEDGKITSEALQQSIEKLKGKPPMLQGEALIHLGLIDHALLNEALQKQLLRRVYDVFTWPEGRYGLVPKIPEDTAKIDLSKSLLEICYRGLLMKYRGSEELSELSADAKPNFVGGQNWSVDQLRLVGREMGVWRNVNGISTVTKIVERSRMDGPTVQAMLLALRDMGLVRLGAGDKMEFSTEAPRSRRQKEGEQAAQKGESGEVVKLLENLRGKSHFEVLGVTRKSTSMEIKEAYFDLAKRFHPDRIASAFEGADRKAVEDLFARISEAHAVLANEETRKEYEASLDLKESGGASSEEAVKILESEMSFQKAGILIRKADFPGAINLLTQAIGLYDKEPEYHLLLGWAMYRNASKAKDGSTMKSGKTKIEKALAQNDRLIQGHFYLGLISKAEGEMDRAKQCFEKVIAIDPRHNEATSELRVINLRQQKEGESVAGGLKKLFKKKGS